MTGADDATAAWVWGWLLNVSYFFCLETWWGASLGKRLFGLRLSSPGGAGWAQKVALRTLVFHIPWLLVSVIIVSVGPVGPTENVPLGANVALSARDTRSLIEGAMTLALIAGLFVTARRANGWAGLHDRASGTLVVSRSTRSLRRRTPAPADPAVRTVAPAVRGPRYGPFTVLSDAAAAGHAGLVIGFDPILRRRVWIRVVAANTPPICAARRDASRTGRLHWLSGRRSASENWDAFEAADGRAWLTMAGPASWGTLKAWLLDLAAELSASAHDGTTPPLRLDRLWVRADGRLVLLDFQAPDLDEQARGSAATDLTPLQLLSSVAAQAMAAPTPSPIVMPLSARVMVARWSRPSPPALSEARAELVRVAAAPDGVWRSRRALPIVLASIPSMLLIGFTALVMLPTMSRFFGPETSEMLGLLEMLYQPSPAADSRLANPDVRRAIEVYLAGRHGRRLEDRGFWESQMMRALATRLAPTAREVAERHPSVSPEELARASDVIAPELERGQRQRAGDSVWSLGGVIITVAAALALAPVLIASIVSSLIVPGGILTGLLGHAVTTRHGAEIGRVRSLARVLVAWSPAIAWLLYLASSPKVQGFVPTPPNPLLGTNLTLAAMAIGGALTIARPSRGPHDWLLGTWVVPR